MTDPVDDLFQTDIDSGTLPSDMELSSYVSRDLDALADRLEDHAAEGRLFDFDYSYSIKTRCRVRNKHSEHVTPRSSHSHTYMHQLHTYESDEELETYPEDIVVQPLQANSEESLYSMIEQHAEERDVLDISIGTAYKDRTPRCNALLLMEP